jgi:hypothetical protein
VRGSPLALFTAAVFALACGVAPATPQQVTEQFWEALRADDLSRARSLATAASARRVDGLIETGTIEEVLLGEALRGETSAIVRTSLATAADEGLSHVTFDTTLVRENRTWRVDVAETQRALTSAAFANSVKQLGDALGQGVQEFGEALEAGAAEISRAIREALDELERDPQ